MRCLSGVFQAFCLVGVPRDWLLRRRLLDMIRFSALHTPSICSSDNVGKRPSDIFVDSLLERIRVLSFRERLDREFVPEKCNTLAGLTEIVSRGPLDLVLSVSRCRTRNAKR